MTKKKQNGAAIHIGGNPIPDAHKALVDQLLRLVTAPATPEVRIAAIDAFADVANKGLSVNVTGCKFGAV